MRSNRSTRASPFQFQIDNPLVNLGASIPSVDWGIPFVFYQPGALRRTEFALHFILVQIRCAAKCQLAIDDGVSKPTPQIQSGAILQTTATKLQELNDD